MNQSKWDKIKEEVKKIVSMTSYATFVKNTSYIQDGDVLLIVSPNDFQRGWLAKNYTTLFSDTVAEVNGKRMEIKFVADDKTEQPLEKEVIKEEDGTERTLKEYLLNRVSELTDKVETLEKTVLKLMNNQNEVNKD
ncbi:MULTISPECIES: DnaA N-terminal domain-containing protein [Bacillus cereus group]|uniref:DnaA N-terminal domain-containing protein n=1 Tax=Bacillus cereus group TaxID=86661 RepID=UPI00159BAE77|nr:MULTISPECIES: DnaA N-terminal domain-containing protein [Bacillus cereus group]